MFFSFKEVETIKKVKLSLALLCGLVFLLVCVPTALGCAVDIKPGSYPNSINVNNNGVITIAIQKEINPDGEIILPEIVKLHLINSSGVEVSTLSNVPHTYQYVDDLVIDPKLTGLESDGYYRGPGYILKFRTQDISGLFNNVIDNENYILRIGFWDNPDYKRAGDDSVRLLSKNK